MALPQLNLHPRFANSEIPISILANNSVSEKLETTLY